MGFALVSNVFSKRAEKVSMPSSLCRKLQQSSHQISHNYLICKTSSSGIILAPMREYGYVTFDQTSSVACSNRR
jgi:hypothetical protein